MVGSWGLSFSTNVTMTMVLSLSSDRICTHNAGKTLYAIISITVSSLLGFSVRLVRNITGAKMVSSLCPWQIAHSFHPIFQKCDARWQCWEPLTTLDPIRSSSLVVSLNLPPLAARCNKHSRQTSSQLQRYSSAYPIVTQ